MFWYQKYFQEESFRIHEYVQIRLLLMYFCAHFAQSRYVLRGSIKKWTFSKFTYAGHNSSPVTPGGKIWIGQNENRGGVYQQHRGPVPNLKSAKSNYPVFVRQSIPDFDLAFSNCAFQPRAHARGAMLYSEWLRHWGSPRMCESRDWKIQPPGLQPPRVRTVKYMWDGIWTSRVHFRCFIQNILSFWGVNVNFCSQGYIGRSPIKVVFSSKSFVRSKIH